MGGARITVWRIDLRAAGLGPPAAPLDAGERARAARMLDPHAARRWAWAHGAMRAILAGHLGLDPAAVAYLAGEGKPRLRPGPGIPGDLDFSLAHSGDWAWLALARGCAVGVDLEQVLPSRDGRAMAKLVCTPGESRVLAGCAGAGGNRAFHRIWVRKEALLKAAGTGFAGPLPAHAVEALGDGPLAGAGAGPWWLVDAPAPPGYLGALAASVPGAAVQWRGFAGPTAPG